MDFGGYPTCVVPVQTPAVHELSCALRGVVKSRCYLNFLKNRQELAKEPAASLGGRSGQWQWRPLQRLRGIGPAQNDSGLKACRSFRPFQSRTVRSLELSAAFKLRVFHLVHADGPLSAELLRLQTSTLDSLSAPAHLPNLARCTAAKPFRCGRASVYVWAYLSIRGLVFCTHGLFSIEHGDHAKGMSRQTQRQSSISTRP